MLTIKDESIVKVAGISVILSFLIGILTALIPSLPYISLSSPFSLMMYGGLVMITRSSIQEKGNLENYEKVLLGAVILLSFIPLNIGILL